MEAFLASFLLIVVAEMWDKTQLLAMAFASRYPWQKVLSGVFFATVLNHGLAVAAGRILTAVVPLHVISLIAAVSFIGFGLWTLHADALNKDDSRTSRFGPVLTVGIAFFLAEMGDKTQLAVVSLAIQYRNIAAVLLGTTAAMLIADAIGIGCGRLLGKYLHADAVRIIAACMFILFGFVKAASILLAGGR